MNDEFKELTPLKILTNGIILKKVKIKLTLKMSNYLKIQLQQNK